MTRSERRANRDLDLITRTSIRTPLAGIEQEWTITDVGRVVDFRAVIDGLPLDGRRLDPDDPNAHRCRSGIVITADGCEAEVATPPMPICAGVTSELEQLAAAGRRELQRACPSQWVLDGYSTHLNIDVPDDKVMTVGRRFVDRYAVCQMMLLDRADSPGLLVRPRRGRLELCGEYATGDQLRAALAFAVVATAAARCRRSASPAPELTVSAANGRFGWYLDRRSPGPDLYRDGRRTMLRTDHGAMTAQSYLSEVWSTIRYRGEGLLAPEELSLVDDAVSGRCSLPLEHPERELTTLRDFAPNHAGASHFGDVVDDLVRPGWSLCCVVARWDTYIFEIRHGATKPTYVQVPGPRLQAFLQACHDGRLDEALGVASTSIGRRYVPAF